MQGKLIDWSSNFGGIFKEDHIDQSTSGTTLISSILSCLSVLDSRPVVDDIRWRICTVVLFRVKRQLFSAFRLSQEDGQTLIRFLIQLGAEARYQNHAARWANIGERYDCLANDLNGLGVLATLPSDGTRDL